MRDPEYLIQLLKDMSKDKNGWILVSQALDASNETLKLRHHVNLLIDVGLSTWESKGVARITMQGYNFLSAIENQPLVKQKYLNLVKEGISIGDAIIKALDIVKTLS